MEVVSRSTKGLSAAELEHLVDALEGEIVLRYATGRRVLDLGHGSPRIAQWTRQVSESLTLSPRHQWRVEANGTLRPNLPPEAFDVVLCLRTLAHVGEDAETSLVAARSLLRAASQATVPGGHVLVEIDNPRSLRGLALGVRNPITVVRSHNVIIDDEQHNLTRYDTLARLAEFTPKDLEFESFFATRVLVPFATTLQIPLLGRLLARAEWWARSQTLLRHFGAHLLVALRKLPSST